MATIRYCSILLLCSLMIAVSYQQKSGSGEADGSGQGEINFLLLLSFKIEESVLQQTYADGPMILPGAELAVEQINQREDLLAGYSVNLTVANSACNLLDHTAVNFVKTFFHSGVRFAGIVGPTCSESVEYLAALLRRERVSVLNFHIASSQKFTDRSRYGYSFGTVSSSHATIGLFLHLMRENEWRSVAVLYEESITVHLTAYDLLVEQLPRFVPNARISFSAPVSEDSLPLSSIINQHIRVVLVLSTTNMAHKIACAIRRHYNQLTFPAYQFIFIVNYAIFHRPANFILNNRRYVCSVEEMIQVIEGFLLTDIILEVANYSTELVSGVTYANYFQQYKEKVNGVTTEWANPIYDGVWSLALALNNSIPRLKEVGLDLVDYTYGHREASDIIRDEVVRLSFEGASGHISFINETGYTSAFVPLYQVLHNTSVLVGYYDEDKEQFLIVGDATFVDNEFESMELVVHPALASLFLLITLAALVLIITTHILTLAYHNYPAIRASSYRLGQLAFVGCYMIIICFLCFTVQKVAPTTSVNTISLCVLQAWSLPLGLTLILGTVTAKTWRLYLIFVHLRKPGSLLHDWVLMIVVLLMAVIDAVLCSVWTAKVQFSTLKYERVTDNEIIEVKVQCDSEHYYAWFGALSLYQGLIMASALVLALLTKNIRHERFSTKSVIFLVYFLTITLSLGSPIYLILNTTRVYRVNAEYCVLSLIFLAVVFLCFFFLFFPPIFFLLREKVFHKFPGLKKFSRNVRLKSKQNSSFMKKGSQ